jgi:tetratricopeptide (TPR) repeat protein
VGELLPAERTAGRDVNPLAYEAFLKGAYWRNRLTEQGFNRGILFFQEAIELQNDYAEAYAAMAACHCRLAGHGIEVVPPDIALPHATQLATRALELDSNLAEANAVLGIIKFKYDWDTKSAETFLNRALGQNPSLFEAHLWLSQVYEGTGRHELAVAQARQARSINPLSPAAGMNLGWQLFQAGQSLPAEIEFDNLLEFDSDFWGGHWGKGYIFLERKRLAEAIAEFSRAMELGGGHTLPLASLGYALAVAGQREEAFAIVEQLREIADKMYVSPVDIATVYAGLNEPDEVFEWLQKAYDVRARSIAWLSVRREFAVVRDDPRFAAFFETVGKSHTATD